MLQNLGLCALLEGFIHFSADPYYDPLSWVMIIIHIIIIIIFLFCTTTTNLCACFPLKPIGVCFLHHWPGLSYFKSFAF